MAAPPLLERAEAPILAWKTVAAACEAPLEWGAFLTAACLIPAGALLARGGSAPETREFCSDRLTFLAFGRWAAEDAGARFVADPALREVFSVAHPGLEARRYVVGETATDPEGLWSYAEPWQTIWVPAGSAHARRAAIASVAPGAPDLVYSGPDPANSEPL